MTAIPTNDTWEARKLLEERLYIVLDIIHNQEHLGDDCFCTTKIAKGYKFALEVIDTYIAQHSYKAIEATRLDELDRLYNHEWPASGPDVLFSEVLETYISERRKEIGV
jgi:hypothetical protein